mmetsp:Transcript_5071/g.7654  ORF Transcript_5071/g.7654 Transcript_5071/m.7654 type:complete len:250 (-) Transcript_5071:696-1445(-)
MLRCLSEVALLRREELQIISGLRQVLRTIPLVYKVLEEVREFFDLNYLFGLELDFLTLFLQLVLNTLALLHLLLRLFGVGAALRLLELALAGPRQGLIVLVAQGDRVLRVVLLDILQLHQSLISYLLPLPSWRVCAFRVFMGQLENGFGLADLAHDLEVLHLLYHVDLFVVRLIDSHGLTALRLLVEFCELDISTVAVTDRTALSFRRTSRATVSTVSAAHGPNDLDLQPFRVEFVSRCHLLVGWLVVF